MLDVRIAQLLGGFGGLRIGPATLAAAIGHDQRAFVGRKLGGDIPFVRDVVNRAGDVALFVGFRAIDIEDRDILGGNGLFEIFLADIRKGSGEGDSHGGEKTEGDQEFFHSKEKGNCDLSQRKRIWRPEGFENFTIVPLRILFAPFGSEGDVNPLIWLAGGLAQRGHEIVFLLTPHYAHRIEKRGWRWFPAGTEEEFLRFANDPRLWQPKTGSELVVQAVLDTWNGYQKAYAQAGGDFDLLVCSSMGLGPATFAEAGGIPRLTLHMQPTCLRSAWDCPLFLEDLEWLCRAPRLVKQAIFWMIDQSLWKKLLIPLNRRRRALGLPALKNFYTEALNGGAGVAALFPAWFGAAQPDWPANIRQFGFPLSHEAPEALPPEIEAFLARGAPVVWTHGSANFDLRRSQELAVECSNALGLRSLLVSLEKPDGILPENVRHVRHAPFDALFPRCRAIVHHGGIGTTSKAIAAGIPQLIIPRSHDQPDNARRVERLGLGRTLSYEKLDAGTLRQTLGALLSSEASQAAGRKYRDILRAENFLPALCDWAENLARPAVQLSRERSKAA